MNSLRLKASRLCVSAGATQSAPPETRQAASQRSRHIDAGAACPRKNNLLWQIKPRLRVASTRSVKSAQFLPVFFAAREAVHGPKRQCWQPPNVSAVEGTPAASRLGRI